MLTDARELRRRMIERAASDRYQFGPRRLWGEVHAAYRWGDEIGRPRAGQ